MSAAAEKPASKRSGDLTHRHRVEKATRQLDLEKNPCTKEQQMSYQCLDDNGYDRDQCSKHFQNYKNCRQFWHLVTSDRKRKGIEPALPPPKDRPQAMEDYKFVMPWK
ncbi:hypothetical protein V1264_023853 [Littorina saxatilis]